MNSVYTVNGWVFSKVREDSNGNSYYNIFHPSGRMWDHSHLFSSYGQMVDYVRNR